MKRFHFPYQFKLTKLNEPVRPPRQEASAKMAGNFMRPLKISKMGLKLDCTKEQDNSEHLALL